MIAPYKHQKQGKENYKKLSNLQHGFSSYHVQELYLKFKKMKCPTDRKMVA